MIATKINVSLEEKYLKQIVNGELKQKSAKICLLKQKIKLEW